MYLGKFHGHAFFLGKSQGQILFPSKPANEMSSFDSEMPSTRSMSFSLKIQFLNAQAGNIIKGKVFSYKCKAQVNVLCITVSIIV